MSSRMGKIRILISFPWYGTNPQDRGIVTAIPVKEVSIMLKKCKTFASLFRKNPCNEFLSIPQLLVKTS
jgi:hypothetical protein